MSAISDQKLSTIRREVALNDEQVYLNTGVVGPLTGSAKLAITGVLFDAAKSGYLYTQQTAKQVRSAVARLINAAPEEIALKNSTTHGVYEALYSIDWKKDDEVIISDVEHHAVIQPLLRLRARYGIVIRYFSPSEGVESFEAQISDKTRLTAFSHVSYITGERLPVKEITAAAHKKNILVLIDGAQSVGAIPVDVKDLDVDYYSLPGQKWLLGSTGTGALYVRSEIVSGIDVSAVNEEEKPYPYGEEQASADIRRYEPALPAAAALAGFGASLQWLEEVGADAVFDTIAATTDHVRGELLKIDGVEVITPENHAGLVSFRVEGRDSAELLKQLGEEGIQARTVAPFGYIRLSFSYFIESREVAKLLETLRRLLA
jgi:L-cysteine/cystine lyase